MHILKRLIDSEEDEDEEAEEAVEVGYWCAACGMLFKRSCTDIEYSWCVRCGATSVREMPWDGTGEPTESRSREASVTPDTGPRTEGPDDPRRRV